MTGGEVLVRLIILLNDCVFYFRITSKGIGFGYKVAFCVYKQHIINYLKKVYLMALN